MAVPRNDAQTTAKFLHSLYCRYGAADVLISDRGSHFCNKVTFMLRFKNKRVLKVFRSHMSCSDGPCWPFVFRKRQLFYLTMSSRIQNQNLLPYFLFIKQYTIYDYLVMYKCIVFVCFTGNGGNEQTLWCKT